MVRRSMVIASPRAMSAFIIRLRCCAWRQPWLPLGPASIADTVSDRNSLREPPIVRLRALLSGWPSRSRWATAVRDIEPRLVPGRYRVSYHQPQPAERD
jgi:hypothetical protein